MTLYDLPREAIDAIVRELGDDQWALSACSLAGRIFLPSCRYRMFSTVSVEYGELGGFLKAIDNPLSTAAPVLRCLRLGKKTTKRSHSRSGSFVQSSTSPYSSPFLSYASVERADGGFSVSACLPMPVVSREVMRILQGVTCVRLEGVPPSSGGNGGCAFWRFLEGLEGVREVEIENRAISEFVVEWVCGLPELEELSVFRSASKAGSLELVEPALSRGSFRCKVKNAGRMRIPLLDIGTWDQFEVVRWLMGQTPVPRVTNLRIGCNRSGFWDGGGACDVQFLKRFVEVVGSNVEHLHIAFPGHSGEWSKLYQNLPGAGC